MRTEEIEYKGIELIVNGNYTEREEETYDLPGCPATFEALDIYVGYEGQISIIDLFSNDDLIEIEKLVLEKICG